MGLDSQTITRNIAPWPVISQVSVRGRESLSRHAQTAVKETAKAICRLCDANMPTPALTAPRVGASAATVASCIVTAASMITAAT